MGHQLPNFFSWLTPIRLLCLCLLLFQGSIQAGHSYSLESLLERASEHQAPKLLQKAMETIEKERLAECANELHLTADQKRRYFSAVRLELGNRRTISYLVFPSRPCDAFCRESTISYWILTRNADGSFTKRYSDWADNVEVVMTRSQGWRDIVTSDGDTQTRLRFNGKTYEPTSGTR